MSASPASRGEALRRKAINQTARVHELCRAIKVGGVWPNGDPLCQAFSLAKPISFSSNHTGGIESLRRKNRKPRLLQGSAQLVEWPLHSLSMASRPFLLLSPAHVASPQVSAAGETGASHRLSDRCCQSGAGRYSPPQLDHWSPKLSRFGVSGGSNKQTNKRRSESGGKKGKT